MVLWFLAGVLIGVVLAILVFCMWVSPYQRSADRHPRWSGTMPTVSSVRTHDR